MHGYRFRLAAAVGQLRRRCLRLMLLLIPTAAVIGLWQGSDRLLRDYAQVWCADQTSRCVNAAVAEVMEDAPVLCRETTDAAGRIVAVRVDAAAVSLLKSRLTLSVSDRLRALEAQGIDVPLGTLLGPHLLNGLGPKVHFRLMNVGAADVEVRSSFQSAGVNQTLHRLTLSVDATLSVLLPGRVLYQKTAQQALLSETLLVGEVPELYAAGG